MSTESDNQPVNFDMQSARRIDRAVRVVEANRPTTPLGRTLPPGANPLAGGVPFVVSLTSDGGSNGNGTTVASYTYTAKGVFDSKTYGTLLLPDFDRATKGTRTAATHGLGYFTKDGGGNSQAGSGPGRFRLLVAFEAPGGTTPCT